VSEPVRSALCEGFVTHRRLDATPHGFRYPVFLTLLDLDELEALAARLRLFGHERRRPLAFHGRDHLAGSGRGLRAELAAVVAAEGHALPPGPVRLLTHCRVLGHVFNPVSFYDCHDREDRLALVVAEVNNTFGDRHCYVLPVEGERLAWTRKKLMHVSPFQPPAAGSYRFEVAEPRGRFDVVIDLTRGGETVLSTRLALERSRPLTDAAIASALARYPFMTLQVLGAIHFEALRLWWKRAPFFPRPPYDPAAARGGPA
jgi:DUF1365 family protein